MYANWTRWLIGTTIVVVSLMAVAFAQDYDPSQNSVANATAMVRPSVVAVETRFDEPRLDSGYEYWQYMRGARPLYGLWGTGFIYKDPQYVITTSFLMSHAEYIRVILDDGRSYEAELIDRDGTFDVAVLKVDWGPDLEPISPSFGDSDALKLGQPIAIVGKALNSVDTFATSGIISAIRKNLPRSEEPTDKFLQFDASFELSFTGAPLIDIEGNVIGMVEDTVGTNLNLGVPINDIIHIADKIIAGEVVDIWHGLECVRLNKGIIDWGGAPRNFDWDGDGEEEEVDYGFWVSHVEEGSPADIAGMKPGDTIVEVDGVFLKYEHDWDTFLRELKVGQLVFVEFIRKNEVTGEFYRDRSQIQILEREEVEEEEFDMDELEKSYLGS